MALWVLLILLVNGVVSFAYTASNSAEPSTVWAMLATTFIYFLGISQAGIVFSAIMRISKSGWGRYFSRLGEILTLSFIPVAFVTFLIIYFGGIDHLFYWAHPEKMEHGHHLSPWLSKNQFLWRGLISMALFYAVSYVYFVTGRTEEDGRAPYDVEKRLNVMSGLVLFTYIITNTNTAWDFGMMIIPHWESSIFPPYFWAGNLLGGSAFLFLMSTFFIQSEGVSKRCLDSIGKVMLGFVLLWMYMHWSQHIVIWYSNLPNLVAPLAKTMSGNFTLPFVLMLLTIFVLPFFALLFRPIKLSVKALFVVAALICTGVWINRYLMVIPVFSDGAQPVFLSWTGISLILSGLAATVLSVIFFLKLFPRVTVTTHDGEGGHH